MPCCQEPGAPPPAAGRRCGPAAKAKVHLGCLDYRCWGSWGEVEHVRSTGSDSSGEPTEGDCLEGALSG